MELIELLLLALCIVVVLKKPEKEKLAFGLFLGGTVICYLMFVVDSFNSFLPFGSY